MTTTPAARSSRAMFEVELLRQQPGIEADLRLKEDGDYCNFYVQCAFNGWRQRAALAESELAEVREQLRIREDERAEQWRLRRDAEGDLITSQAVVSEMRAELERVKALIPECQACKAVQENEQDPNTECDACGWAGLRNGRPIGAGEGEAG